MYMIEIKEFEKDMEEKNFEKIYWELVKRTIELTKTIAQKRNISLDFPLALEKIDFYSIQYVFEKSTPYFGSIPKIMNSFSKWNVDFIDKNQETEEHKITIYINLYNRALSEFQYYQKIESQIKKKGYQVIEKKYINKLILLFKEMLQYKNKEYQENCSFKEWVECIDTYYHYYHEELEQTLEEILFSSYEVDNYDELISVTKVEKIIQLKSLYYTLTEKGNDYKKYADYYKEFELKDGKTYYDLYHEYQEKIISLFEEMLDYAEAFYDKKRKDFDYLKIIVTDYYPFYSDTLLHLGVMISNPKVTYIELLNSMSNIYDMLSKNYKKREQLLKDYQEEWAFDE